METYHIKLPAQGRLPIVLSVPHCGIAFPREIINDYSPELIKGPDDTDRFVDQLYDFAPALGVTMISAVLSRWVIDLNRDPFGKPLYSDGRIVTGLCPVTTFLGQNLYKDGREALDKAEVARRTQLYFNPYHDKLAETLTVLKSEFGRVLLWDCHSIRQRVPTIQNNKFPDLILGTADGKSAQQELIEITLQKLSGRGYSLQHNHPFKGGFITRRYGNPSKGQHALQLEMSKINYMDDMELKYHPARAKKIRELLYNTLYELGNTLISLKD